MTKLCRFNDSRLGIVQGDVVLDVTPALEHLSRLTWPFPPGDQLIAELDEILPRVQNLALRAPRLPLTVVRLHSPVANPSKVIAAPVNYLRHQAEAIADGGVNFDKDVKTISHYGLFLKANTSVAGPAEGVVAWIPGRRTDHEIELVVVIGRGGRNIQEDDALAHVAGYTVGLDMTLRGPEDRSLRKSLDTFSVAGPWLTTRDEIENPNNLGMTLAINGQIRQRCSTKDLIFNVQKLISYASSFYTLYPGDLIYTGTPEGVGPVEPGDRLLCSIEGVGHMEVGVRSPS